jgi:glycosyltransferase involved in cell wall biosynthesis
MEPFRNASFFVVSRPADSLEMLMSDQPLFSVVIPTYNRGEMISATLETVLAQTYPHYEVIVVDDCSTDETEKVLDPYIKSQRIRYFRHDQNYERAAARNTGMENAAGDFVTFLDSDDFMYPNNLEDAAEFVRTHSQVIFFHNLYHLVDSSGRVIFKYRFPSLADRWRAISAGNFLSCHGVFIHREIYRRYRFDVNPILTASEDWEFWIRVLADYEVGRIDRINTAVVHHPGRSIKHLDFEQLRQRMSYIVEKVRNDPHLYSVYRKYLKRLETGSLIYMSTVANDYHDHAAALKCLLRAAAKDFRVLASVNFAKSLRVAIFQIDRGF